MLEHLLNYVFSPQIAIAHLVGGGLLWGLVTGGVSKKRAVLVAGAEELLCSFLWWLIPDSVKGLAVIFLLYVAIRIYEQLTGPRVKVNKGAVFVAEKRVSEVLQSVGELVVVREELAEDGRVYLYTNLAYAEYWFSFWGGGSGKWAIDVAEVHTADEGCEKAIVKSLGDAGVQLNQCFCLSVGTDLSVTCAAETTEVRNQWVEGFRRCLGNRTEVYKAESIQRHFEQFAVHGEKEALGVNMNGILTVLQKFGRNGDKAYVKELFNTFAKIANTKSLMGEAILTKDTFGKFLELVLKRPEIQQIYERLLYKKRSEVALSPQRLKEFLAEEQKEDVSFHQCKDWISQWESIIPFNSFSSVGFTSFLMSEDQAVMDRRCKTVYQDMLQPLSHYFIATSHNTYLTKDQLKGKSSVDAYTTAFKRGCKCVELDCWDGPNNEPIIYHGHTLTSKILFKDAITAIRDSAFVMSQYPVILSFENHCSIEQQKVMAGHLTTILAGMLYTKPIPEEEAKLPSPDELKGCIIVKAKKLQAGAVDDDDFDEESDDDSDSDDEDDKMPSDKSESKNEKRNRKSTSERERHSTVGSTGGEDEVEKTNGIEKKDSDGKEQVSGDETQPLGKDEIALERRGSSMSITNKLGSLRKKDSMKRKSKKEKLPKIAQELSDLVFYCQAVHFSSFANSKEKSKHYQMSSFGEKKAMRYTKEDPVSFTDYNQRQLARIYPAGSRVDSSNYDPQPLWNAGCQLVALNYQTPDKSMQLNQGLFADNGFCGYVLKPDFLRQENPTFDPRGPFDDKKVRFLMVRVISGIQVPYADEKKVRSERNLQVHLTIKGVDADNQKEKTKVVKNNGYSPMWNDIIGFKIHVFELAMLTFTLKEGDSFLGQYTLPVRCLQQGYRRVPLQTKSSDVKPHSSLFVHIEFKETH